MKRFRRTTLISLGCISVLVGLGLSRKLQLEFSWGLIVFLPLFLLLRRKSRFSLLVVILLGLALGLVRGDTYMQKLSRINSLAGQKVQLQATATADAVYSKGSQMEFTASHATLVYPLHERLAGSIKVSGFGVPMVYRGQRLDVEGKLYPMRGANQARISYARLATVGPGAQWFNDLSRRFTAGMQNALPEPQASFGLGLLIGQRTNMPQEIVTMLTMVGLVHIVAVSGYNLTILVRAAQRLRLQSKYQRTVLSLFLIGGFLVITGFSASIVRAAVVSGLGLWAAYYGRDIKALLLILFSAALTGFLNPFYVWSDVGWYLSFLAFFGVLIIAPLLTARFFKKPPRLLTSVLIETLCAEIMTLPLIMMIFGQMSLIGLVANLLVVPLIPWAMLLASLSATAGLLMPQFAGWLAWPARVLLTYMLDIAHLLAGIPSVFLRVSISLSLMIFVYAIIGLVILAAQRRLKEKQLLLRNEEAPAG